MSSRCAAGEPDGQKWRQESAFSSPISHGYQRLFQLIKSISAGGQDAESVTLLRPKHAWNCGRDLMHYVHVSQLSAVLSGSSINCLWSKIQSNFNGLPFNANSAGNIWRWNRHLLNLINRNWKTTLESFCQCRMRGRQDQDRSCRTATSCT